MRRLLKGPSYEEFKEWYKQHPEGGSGETRSRPIQWDGARAWLSFQIAKVLVGLAWHAKKERR